MATTARSEDHFLNKHRNSRSLEAMQNCLQAIEPTASIKLPKMTAMIDKVLIRPMEPRRSHGAIALASSSIKAERALTIVGQVVGLGSQAFVATPDGLDYSVDKDKIVIGSWVMYRKHAGQPIRVKKSADEKVDSDDQTILLAMEDRDILAVFESKEDAEMIWHWVGT